MFSKYIEDPMKVFEVSVKFFRDKLIKDGLESLVLGVSGGADSTLMAAICHEAVKGLDGVRFLGYSLPTKTNKEDEKSRAEEVIEAFCTFGEVFPIGEIVNLKIKQFGIGNDEDNLIILDPNDTHKIKVRAGNIKARTRMEFLYDTANQFNGIVVSTDNLTEYMLGFWPVHGDVGDHCAIQYIWKSEVYDIMTAVAEMYQKSGESLKAKVLIDSINAKPTDGLGVSNSDFDQFGFEADVLSRLKPRDVYRLVEDILNDYIEAKATNDLEAMKVLEQNKIIKLHNRSHFKRKGPEILSRELLV